MNTATEQNPGRRLPSSAHSAARLLNREDIAQRPDADDRVCELRLVGEASSARSRVERRVEQSKPGQMPDERGAVVRISDEGGVVHDFSVTRALTNLAKRLIH